MEEVVFHLPHCTEPKGGRAQILAMPFPSLLKGDAPECWSEPAELFWAVDFIHLPAFPQGKHLARNVSYFRDGQSPPPLPLPLSVFTAAIPDGLHHNRPTSSPGAQRLYLRSY